jgi:hypothetical protein
MFWMAEFIRVFLLFGSHGEKQNSKKINFSCMHRSVQIRNTIRNIILRLTFKFIATEHRVTDIFYLELQLVTDQKEIFCNGDVTITTPQPYFSILGFSKRCQDAIQTIHTLKSVFIYFYYESLRLHCT